MIGVIAEKILPHFIYKQLFKYYKYKEWYLIRESVKQHASALSKLKGKGKLRCVFFALFEEVWKYDVVYHLMEVNPRFDPIILVCPIISYGRENMIKRMEQCYIYFQGKGYNVIKAYDGNQDNYVDVIKQLSPDIIFYTNPYKGLIDDRYYITNYPDVLTVYVPYYYNEGVGYEVAYNNLFQNLLWRRYVETTFHNKLSRKYGRNKGRNSVVVGYPGIERLINPIQVPNNIWKQNAPEKKKIIWAPHHTLTAAGKCNYSCFLKYYDFMLKMAEKYADKCQFAFKPHPLLRNKLDILWGEEKTEVYYNKWMSMPNTTLKEGDYINLFLTSDAMIHDSGSFLIEYLYVNKPVLRTLNDIPLDKLYNPFALKCLDYYYMAYTERDIEEFIKNVINGVDPLKEQRTKFVNEELMPPKSPSQLILEDILDSVDNQILYRN